MADVSRTRPLEFYNPRPLILGMCFFWGVVMGFCLFYFSPPKELTAKQPEPPAPDAPAAVDPGARWLDAPNISDIPDSPPAAPTERRVSIETMEIAPPPPVLTTEGGLTGRTAVPIRPPASRPAVERPIDPMQAPIPELMP